MWNGVPGDNPLVTFIDWARRHHRGDETLALAFCTNAIAEVGGREFDQLPNFKQAQLIQLFTGWIALKHPNRSDVDALAYEFLTALTTGQLGG